MPNPTRLHHLTDLREAAGLTLAEMAQRCGIPSKQGRKTAGDWEAGRATPRASRRNHVLRYLWYDLCLSQNPTRFEEVWTILVEEWAWEPLGADERAQLLREPPPPLTTTDDSDEAGMLAPQPVIVEAQTHSPALRPLEPLPSEPAALVEEAAAPQPPMQPILTTSSLLWWHGFWRRRRWALVGVPFLLLLLSVTFWRTPPLAEPLLTVLTTEPTAALPSGVAITAVTSTQFISNPVVQAVNRPSTLLPALTNGDFEQPVHFTGWNVYSECDYQIAVDATLAHSGDRYLTIHNRQPRCYSFYQDIPIRPAVGVTYRAAIWLRSATGDVRRGRLALWALGANREHQESSFSVGNMAWTCLETTLLIQQPDHDQLRFEVYLDSHDGLAYYFDSAILGQGPDRLCPAPELMLADLQIEQPSGLIYPASTVGVQAWVKNSSATAEPAGTFLRYWVSATEQGAPLDPGTIRVLPVPPLAAGETATIPHLDLYLPINMPEANTYFVVVDLAATDQSDDFTSGYDRASRAFTLTRCMPGTLYCDVPADHWAAPEIQAWFDAGISQGCRSNTEPFLNRPFCPDALMQRWMMALFLLRRLEGKDYQPTNAYQGLFEDLPEDFDSHQSALRIEALTTQRVDMRSPACPPRGEHRRFCPNDPLRRADFARALLVLQRWDVSDVEGTFFTDMEAGSDEARAAEYMWRQGYLPTNDTDCPGNASYRRFCPNAPLRRASAAVMMSRALGLVGSDK